MTKTFDFDAEKKATIAKLEALEKVGIEYKKLQEKVKNIDIVLIVQEYLNGEVDKIEKLAKKHLIDFKVDVDSLIGMVVVPGTSLPEGHTILPFMPSDNSEIEDNKYQTWRYVFDFNPSTGKNDFHWTTEWVNSWNDSNC